ncbi:hypothetical protein CIK05_09175 [Bdellovibrio sp. qaytius]|nr:hypothetical protein CIK05_09175 [Bdellovibrio sp. qaytius]
MTSFSANSAVNATGPKQAPILSEQFAGRKVKEIPFFKSKQSIFPSGHASFDKLNEQLISSETSEAFYLAKDEKKISPTLIPHITAFHLSRVWIEKYTKRRVKPNNTADLATVLLNYDTDPYDRGLVLTLNDTKLRATADIKAAALKSIPKLNYFIPISFEKGFIKILFSGQFGFIDINDCISKYDFAKFAFSFKSKTNTWEVINHREFDSLITDKNESLQLGEIKGLVVDQKLAYAFKENDHYPKWTSFKLIKEKTKPWIQSEMKGHGQIWWQRPDTEILSQNTISIDDLIKKEIYSVSFQEDNPKKGLASAHGVFITEDGQNWNEIPQFKDYSGPVYYFSNSLMYVGNYRSIDGGKTFESFIQIDKVSSAITKSTGVIPKKIQITKIKVQKPYSVVIDVQTGTKKIRLKSPIFSQDWVQAKY